MSKVSIVTLGCKQNKYESDCMASILKDAGYEVTEELEYADIYIINTCAVTNEAEKKSRQYLAKFNSINPNSKIIVCGCASENNMEQFENKPGVFSIFGTEGKQNILDYINNSIKSKVVISKKYESPKNPEKTTTRQYLKIQDGCNNFCSYCLIPYLRGRSRSRDIEDIVKEAFEISKSTHEIVLTGIDISSYEIDGKPGLIELMKRLGRVDATIRLGSLEINVITEELLRVLSSMKNFAPHFHLSLQSGDDEILKKMNRHYSTNEFYEKSRLIFKYFPDANLTTDVIVGFAGETEEQFENTKKFIEKVGFSFVHIFPYSRRPGTLAYNYPDITMKVKKARVDALEMVNERLKNAFLSKFIGRESLVIIEEKKEFFEGFSPEYIRCFLDYEDLISGHIYKVRFIEIHENGLKCEIV